MPCGSVRITCPHRLIELTTKWVKAMGRALQGAPGGEGFRMAYLAECTPVLPLAAQWLEALHDMKWTPEHAGFHRFKTIGGSIKPNDDGTMPTTVGEVTSIRPLCRPSRIQVTVTSPLAQNLSLVDRDYLMAHNAYGNAIAGCDTAIHKMNLTLEMHPDWPHASLDSKNAYCE